MKDYVVSQRKNENLASLMNIGKDRQELITSGPPSNPRGVNSPLFSNNKGEGGLRGYFGVCDSRKSRYFGVFNIWIQ